MARAPEQTKVAKKERSAVREVAVPSEHGGWSLTLEPAVLGLIIAPSLSGLAIGLAGLLAFIARTPAKLVLIDRFRNRWLPRTSLAAKVASVEIAVIIALFATATVRSGLSFWVPTLVAAPLLTVEGYYEIRSKGRRLVPELAGSVAIAVLASMIALAGGESKKVAYGLWLVMAARAVTALPHVKSEIMRRKGKPFPAFWRNSADAIALGACAVGIVLDSRLIVGAAAVLVAIVYQRVMEHQPSKSAIFIGLSQMAVGIIVVIATAVGMTVS